MKTRTICWEQQTQFTRWDRILLHLYCLYRDHKYRWHLAGIWREVTFH